MPATQAQIEAARQELAANNFDLGHIPNIHAFAKVNKNSNVAAILNWNDSSAANAYREYQLIQLIIGGVV